MLFVIFFAIPVDDSQASDSVKAEHNGSFEMIDNLGQPETGDVGSIKSGT